jgi:hypothetical protein
MVAGQPVAVQSPARGVGGVDFLDDGGLHKIGGAGRGEKFADFFQGKVDDLGARFVDEGL